MTKNLFTPEWYPFYQKKFTSATQLYNAEAIGAYIVLLNYQWDNGGLPDDIQELMSLAKCSEPTIIKVLKKFTKREDGLYWNKRLEDVREEQYRKYLVSKARADKANATIREKKKDADGRSTLRPTSNQRNDNVTYKEEDKDISKDIVNDGTVVPNEKVVAKKRIRATFKKPEWKDVANYLLTYLPTKNINWSREKIKEKSESFIDHYISNGWMVGKNPMADWEATVRKWIKNDEKFDTSQAKPTETIKPTKFLGEE